MQGTSWPLPSASKPGNLLVVLVLCCCDKALLEFLVKPLVNFYQLRKLGTLVDNTFLKVPNTLLLERPLFAHEPRSVALELSLLLLILLQLMNYPVRQTLLSFSFDQGEVWGLGVVKSITPGHPCGM